MREILFKAKREDNGEWVYGYYLFVKEQNKHYILTGKIASYSVDCSHSNLKTNGFEWFEVAPETLCEYTGLKDKNGNKIWENDIVKWDLENKKLHKASVKYHLGGFVYKQVPQGFIQDYPPHPMFIIDESKVEVIGNKFEEVESEN